VLWAAALGEAPQHLLGLGCAQAQRRGVLDHLVVVAGDQVPVETREIASDAAFTQLGKLAFPQASAMFPEAGIG